MFQLSKKILYKIIIYINRIVKAINKLTSLLDNVRNHLIYKEKILPLLFKNFLIALITLLVFKNSTVILYYFIISIYALTFDIVLDILIIILKILSKLIAKIPDFLIVLSIIIFTLLIFIVFSFISSIIVTIFVNNFISENNFFIYILTCLFLSLLSMMVLSLVYNYYFYKNLHSDLVYYTVNTLLYFIIGICFTALFGLKDAIINYTEWYITAENGKELANLFYNTYHFTVADAITILMYWFFALALCFQTTHKVAKKAVTNHTISQSISGEELKSG